MYFQVAYYHDAYMIGQSLIEAIPNDGSTGIKFCDELQNIDHVEVEVMLETDFNSARGDAQQRNYIRSSSVSVRAFTMVSRLMRAEGWKNFQKLISGGGGGRHGN